MRIPHLKIHQGLCGLAVALALAALPLPAVADETTPSQTTDTTQSTPVETPTSQPVLTNVSTDAPTLQTSADAPLSLSVSLPVDNPTPSAPVPATNLGITNTLDSNATSGTATVNDNEKAGDASSGNATASATVLNVANTTGLTAKDFTTFQCDVNGEVQDNLVIDPTSLLPICKTTTVGSTQQPGSSQSLQTGASLVDILNDIVLSANSGDATVDGNEEAGDATSGDAAALANIVNIANSAIGAKNSFLGVINIYGTLKGNILVPQSIVDSLISPTDGSGIPVGDTTIANNAELSANSGDATVSDNEDAGDATTGDANTSLMVYNLTGQEVVAKNSLLVFVNVLGKWVGLIVPAGEGATSAMLGSGVQNNTTNVINGASEAGDSTTNITNNVTVDAKSGDASVTNNEKAGNATSGKAQAGANLVNITHSNFWLDNWFGMLFINVLGDWLGNFDIQADALPAPATPSQPSQPIQDVRVYQFTEPAAVKPAATSPKVSFQQTNDRDGANITDISAPAGTVLSATDDHIQFVEGDQAARAVKLDLLALGAIILALTLLIATGTMILRRWHTA